jgi:hypothetical protein
VKPESNAGRARPYGLWLWAAAGLVGPAATWASVSLAPDRKLPLSEVVAVLYPTWLFGWLVMGQKSNGVGNAILALTVVGNVAVFTGIGIVFRQLNRGSLAMRWGTTAVVYAAVYAAITLIAYHVL